MMGEEEITLTWRNDFLPIGRSRNRFPYDFDRNGNTFVLQGSIAYERLRVCIYFSKSIYDVTKHDKNKINISLF